MKEFFFSNFFQYLHSIIYGLMIGTDEKFLLTTLKIALDSEKSFEKFTGKYKYNWEKKFFEIIDKLLKNDVNSDRILKKIGRLSKKKWSSFEKLTSRFLKKLTELLIDLTVRELWKNTITNF